MLKYYETLVSFREVPDEISLCIDFVNCPYHCKGCHSPWLQGNEGTIFNLGTLMTLLGANKGISCVCFMGGDVTELQPYFRVVKEQGLKVAYYTGACTVHSFDRQYLDYIKIGAYEEDKGPLTSRTTNQRFYKRVGNSVSDFDDITEVFWNE